MYASCCDFSHIFLIIEVLYLYREVVLGRAALEELRYQLEGYT